MEEAVDTGGGEVVTTDAAGTGELPTSSEELGGVLPAELAPAHAVARNPSATELTAAMTGLNVRIRRTAQSRLCDEHGQPAANAIVIPLASQIPPAHTYDAPRRRRVPAYRTQLGIDPKLAPQRPHLPR
jgi:hypothetical protein